MSSTRLGQNGGQVCIVVDGGSVMRASGLRLLARFSKRVAVLRMPTGRNDLDWLAPIAPHVEDLSIFDACDDLSLLQHFPRLQQLTLRFAPHATTSAMHRQATTLRRYSGPWFPALDPVLAAPVLRDLTLERPPSDIAQRMSAPLEKLRLLSARKLSAVPLLECISTLKSLEITGGGALDLNGVSRYLRLANLDLNGRNPISSFAELAQCMELRRLVLEECYSIENPQSFQASTLDELIIIRRYKSFDPDLKAWMRDVSVPYLSTPVTTK